jgi:MFS family permease
MATFHGGWSFAGLLGGAMGLLMTTLGAYPLLHFVIIAILTLAGTAMNFQYLQPDIKVTLIISENGAQKNKPELFLLLLGIVGFFGMAAEGAMTDWNGLYLQDVVNIETHLAPLGLIAYMATMATGRFVMDKVTQKWGRKRVLQFSGLSIFLGLFMTVTFPNFFVAIVAFMIVGFGTCGVVPTLYSAAGQKTRIPTGMALTIVSSISFLGFLLGPPIIGYISNVTNLRYSYALIGIFGVCIMIMSSQLKVLKNKYKE